MIDIIRFPNGWIELSIFIVLVTESIVMPKVGAPVTSVTVKVIGPQVVSLS